MVQRHKFNPASVRMSVEEQRHVTPDVAPVPDTNKEGIPKYPLVIGVFSLVLSLIPVCIGIYEFEELQKPSNLPLARFDALFRKAGSLLPFIPLTLRCLVQIQGESQGQAKIPVFFRSLQGVALHVAVLAVRLGLYRLHVLGQRQGIVAGDLVADHCVLGVSVQAALAFEIAAALLVAATSRGAVMAFRVYTVCAASAWMLLLLVSFDMRDTAKYFHHSEESLLGVALGVAVFALPMCYLLLTPVLRKRSSLRQNGFKNT